VVEVDAILRAEMKHGPCSISSLQKVIDTARSILLDAIEDVNP
jgi:hypothetical protein